MAEDEVQLDISIPGTQQEADAKQACPHHHQTTQCKIKTMQLEVMLIPLRETIISDIDVPEVGNERENAHHRVRATALQHHRAHHHAHVHLSKRQLNV